MKSFMTLTPVYFPKIILFFVLVICFYSEVARQTRIFVPIVAVVVVAASSIFASL